MKSSKAAQYSLWEESQKVVNVASVPQRSPFRYPGGKTWLVPRIRQWLTAFSQRPKLFVEPFAGGAIIGLTVAFEDLADKVILVELDEQVASVWQTIIDAQNGAEWLAKRIVSVDLTAEKANNILKTAPKSQMDLAFKTIVQNRVSHGGILAHGAGLLKNGENGKGVLSRWYPETLKRRILEIAKVKDSIKFIFGDGFEVITKFSDSPNAVFFIDPPYTASKKKAGRRLYKHHNLDHEKLFEQMSKVKGDFLITYDDAEEVRSLAARYRFETRLVNMTGTHNAKRSELLIGRNLGWL